MPREQRGDYVWSCEGVKGYLNHHLVNNTTRKYSQRVLSTDLKVESMINSTTKKMIFQKLWYMRSSERVLSTGLNARATRSGSWVELLTLCLFFTEMLQFRKQKSLAAQAMHELGNIMFHSGNIRFVLDCDWWVVLVIVIIFRHIHDCRLCFPLVASLSVLYNWYISLRLWLVFNWKTCLIATIIILVIVTVMTIIVVMIIIKVIVMIIYLW